MVAYETVHRSIRWTLVSFLLVRYPLKSSKQGKGQENRAVQFAFVNFEPGSFLYADEDGILISKDSCYRKQDYFCLCKRK